MEKAVAKIGELGINRYIVGCKCYTFLNRDFVYQN